MSSGSGSSSDGLGESGEIGWMYATPLEGSKQKTQCNFCGKQIRGGGITRLKHHLVGGHKNVAKCSRCPQDVRDAVRASLAGKKAKDVEKGKRDAAFKEVLFHEPEEPETVLSSSSDDGIAYPADMTTSPQRRAYRIAIKESIRSEHERQELAGGSRRHHFETGSGSGSGAAQPSKKHKASSGKGIGRSSSTRAYIPSSDPKQKTVRGMFGNVREKVGKALGKLFFAHGIPANVASGPFLQHAVDVISTAGTGVKAPTAYELMNKYLPMEKVELEMYIKGLKKMWPEYGVTIMCDGWTSYTRKQIINFLVYCDGRTVFLKSVDASDNVKDHRYIYKLLRDVIKEVGKENVVQIVTDNGSNFKKAGQKIMNSSKYGIFWTPCAAHCIDLILKDFGKKRLIENIVEQARSITTFIYNHSHILAMMRRYCDGDLVRPGITRFATNFIALQSIVTKKVGLKEMFNSSDWFEKKESRTDAGRQAESLIGSIRFWDDCGRAIRIMEPIVLVLRMVDGDKKPTMGSIYAAIEMMKDRVKENAGKSSKGFLKIIELRWNNMLLHPLHQAAYYLNPHYQYKHKLGFRSDLLAAVQVVVEKVVKDPTTQTACMNEIKYFREALQSFGRITAINGRDRTLPAEWWMLYGADAPNLKKVAVRILSQTASAGGCERNWSTFNLIHSRKRNRLGSDRLHDLVFVHYNTRLRMKHAQEGQNKEDYLDPIDVAYIFNVRDDDDDEDVLQKWMDSNGAPVLDEGGRPNPDIARQMGTDVDDFMLGSGRRIDPIGGLESDDEPSSSKSKTHTKDDDDSGDDAGLVVVSGSNAATGRTYSHDDNARGSQQGQGQDTYREYAGHHMTNIHGERIPTPSPDPMDYEQYTHYGGDHEMEDLTSSVGSLSLSMGDSFFGPSPMVGTSSSFHHGSYYSPQRAQPPPVDEERSYGSSIYPDYFPAPPPPSYNQGGYYDNQGQPGQGYGFFPEYYPIEPPRQQQPIPSTTPQHSRRRSSPTSSHASASAAGPSRRATATSRTTTATATSDDSRYPRIGMLSHVGDVEYRKYIDDYRKMYNYMTWENYCEFLEACQRHERHQQRRTSMDPARSSSWY